MAGKVSWHGRPFRGIRRAGSAGLAGLVVGHGTGNSGKARQARWSCEGRQDLAKTGRVVL